MPLVRISLLKDRPAGLGKKIGAVMYRTIADTINISLTDGIVFIQITLNEGRTVEMKKAFYKTLAERLNQEINLRMGEILINLVKVKKENWSFGNGIAQYAQ